MVEAVVFAVVGFLKTDNSVHAVVRQFLVLLGLEGHNLNFEIGEVGFGQIQRLGEIGHAGLGGIFARHDEQVLKGAELFDGFVLAHGLFGCEDGAFHFVGHVEAAIDAGVGTGVGEVEGDEHRHGAPKPLLGVATREAGHLLQIGLCRRGDERHEIVGVKVCLSQGALHVGRGFGSDGGGGFVPAVLF